MLIMDEPTASLAKHETEALFQLVERLKARGISIVYISHRMDEVYRIADRITILRDGQRLFTKRLSEVTPAQIVEGIVGRKIEGELEYQERDRPVSRTALLEARHLQAGTRVNDVSFTLHEGEILGLAGLMGSGRTELARVLFGIDPISSGEVLVRGQQVSLNNPRDASDHGIALRAGGPPAAGPHPGPLRPGELCCYPCSGSCSAARSSPTGPARRWPRICWTDSRSKSRTPVDPFGCSPVATSRRSSSPSGSAPTPTC